MKKKIIIPIVALVILLAVLFVPIPTGVLRDGGTREFRALTYKIVSWNRLYGEDVYKATKVYFGADAGKSADELFAIEVKNNILRQTEYTEEWIDKTKAEKYDTRIFSDIVITEIYSNCFFARTVIPMPYTIKLNGTLSEDWCVGDQVVCTYKNVYYDSESSRVECDLTGIEASDWEPEPGVAYKPVIYLYPECETEVTVKLGLNGELSCTYPSYGNGWEVIASPDGTLTDKNGRTYNYLYWEGEIDADFDLSRGFCVKGEDTAAFLEAATEKLGLSRREANEFIVFWLPMMQNNPYNIISFQEKAYTDAAALDISPAPDTLIRVFMTWRASEVYVDLPPKELEAPVRDGFTVVEWGGTEIK